MKKMTSILGALAIAAALTAGFTACTSDDNIIGNEPITEQPGTVKTYQVSIPATMPDDATTRAVEFGDDGTTSTSRFQTTEAVYVYNVTTSTILGGALQPTNISEDGKHCDLTGDLTGTINSGDDLRLFYNLNYYSPGNTSDTNFSYGYQNGTQAEVLDGAVATVKVSDFTGGVLTTTAVASFQPLQSMFRQRLTFKNASDETVTPTITSLKITSKNDKLVSDYFPLISGGNENARGSITINNPVIDANGDIYLSLRFVGSDGTDALTFTAIDADENVYECTKNAPTGGFQNGKYYYGSMTLPYVRKMNMPIFTGTENYSFMLVNGNMFRINNNGNPVTFGISGTCSGYTIFVNWVGVVNTITISNLNATFEGSDYFLDCNHGLNLVVNGDNSITCPNHTACIGARNSDAILKLSGNGTLTVTANDADYYGLSADSNYNISNNSDASVLAATGYTVTRSARTDNADGTYTWTYTVAPNN